MIELIRRHIFIFSSMFILMCGLGVSLYVFQSIQKSHFIEGQRLFERVADSKIGFLQEALEKNRQILNALKGLYISSESVGWQEFRNFSGPVLDGEYFIQALVWIPEIRLSEIDAYIERARNEGLDDFLIKSSDPGQDALNGALYPVYYAVPLSKNGALLGSVLNKKTEFVGALQSIRQKQIITSTEPLRLFENSDQLSYLVLNPVFDKGRMTGVAGVVLNYSLIRDLVATKFSYDMELHIYDVTNPGEKRSVFDDDTRRYDHTFSRSKVIAFYGRRWLVEVSGAPDSFMMNSNRYAWIAAFLPILLSFVLIVPIVVANRLRARALHDMGDVKDDYERILHGMKTITEQSDCAIFKMHILSQRLHWFMQPKEILGLADHDACPDTFIGLNRIFLKNDRMIWDQVENAFHDLLYVRNLRLITQYKKLQWFELRLMKSAEQPEFVFGALRNINQSKYKELIMKNKVSFFERSPYPIFEIDRSFNILDLNPALMNFFPSFTLTQNLTMFFDVDVRNKIEAVFEFQEFFSYVRESENGQFFQMCCTPYLVDGTVERCRIYCFEVNSLQSHIESLKGEKERAAFIFEKDPALIAGIDQNGLIKFVNPSFCQLTGYRNEELIGKNIWSKLFLDEDDPEARNLNEHISAQGEIQNYDMIIQTKSGKSRIVSWSSINRWKDKDVEETILFGLDVTERNRFQSELVKAKEQAEEVSRSKSDFIASMSHEIRTPMNGLIATASLLQESRLDDNQRKYVQTMMESGDHLLSIINDILDISKIEAGKMDIVPVPFALDNLINSVFNSFKDAAQQKNLYYGLSYDEGIPQYVVADPARLRQIVNNFLSNAIKFTEKGVIELKVDLQDVYERDVALRFAVIDTGAGIPEDRQQDLFEKFTQINAHERPDISGTGLGLAISKYLVDSMNGEIGVQSKEGEGSTFWFKISVPLANDTQVASLEKQRDLVKREGVRFNADILLVEDVELNQLIVGDMLKMLGIRHDKAYNGEEALEKIAEKDYDLILMDWRMPKMDGIEATEIIRDQEKQEPDKKKQLIVALSAHAMEQYKQECLDAGMNDFLAKPLKKEDLTAMLAKWLPDHIAEGTTSSKNERHDVAKDAAPVPSDENEERFNPSVLQELMDMNPEIAKVVASTGLEDLQSRVAALQESVEQQDPEEIANLSHAMKSVALEIGALEFSALCKTLEQKGRTGKLRGTKSLYKKLCAELSYIEQKVETFLNN